MKCLPPLLVVLVLYGLATALAQSPIGGDKGVVVSVPWRPGNADGFQLGAVEERRAKSAQGLLPVTIYRPASGPSPFVVLMHGCGGLGREATWTAWVRPWVDLFLAHGLGTAVVDSFGPRGVDQVCNTGTVAGWAVRRADDAYSVRGWLTEQPYVDAQRIAVMGMSNGGRTVLSALRTTLKHADPFAAGVALYPGCQTDVDSQFYAPLLVLIGSADTVTPVRFCQQMKQAQPASAPELKLVVYPRGPHTFDMRLPDRTVLGMRLGYDPQADADARHQVIEFLTAHGIARPESKPQPDKDR